MPEAHRQKRRKVRKLKQTSILIQGSAHHLRMAYTKRTGQCHKMIPTTQKQMRI